MSLPNVEVPAALNDLVRLRDKGESVELVEGTVVHKAAPSPAHGAAQLGLGDVLAPMRRRRHGGTESPGGWWLMTDVEVLYANGDVYRHDAVGFRRDRHPERPGSSPVAVRPDWAAEILSAATARRDLVTKFRTLLAAAVPHYWVIDAEHELLTVYRHTPVGCVTALTAGVPDVVNAEPFEAIEISMAVLFGKDE